MKQAQMKQENVMIVNYFFVNSKLIRGAKSLINSIYCYYIEIVKRDYKLTNRNISFSL